MLIISQTKSASSSLLYTLSEMMKIKAHPGTKRKDFHILDDGYEQLQKYHTLIFERSPLDIMKMITSKKLLYREHLLPTQRVFKILDKHKNFIVLLRNPFDSYDNYRRVLEKTNEINEAVLDDLIHFNEGYKEYIKTRPDILTINYEDLIIDYNKTMDKVRKYWNIKSKIIKLKKVKYTGIGIKRLKGGYNE
jgi:hypothetical protein